MADPREERNDPSEVSGFDDWESVWVQHRWTEGFPLFRFTAVERDPYPDLWTKQQFNPGEIVADLSRWPLGDHRNHPDAAGRL